MPTTIQIRGDKMRFNNGSNHYKHTQAKYKRFIDGEWMVNGFTDFDSTYLEDDRFFVLLEDKNYKIQNEKSAKFQLSRMKQFGKYFSLPFLGMMTKSIVPDIDKHKELEYKARVPLHKCKVMALVTNFYDGKRLDAPVVITEEENVEAKFNFNDIQACLFEWLDRNNLITEAEKQQYRELYKVKRREWWLSDLRDEIITQLADEGLNKEASDYLKELVEESGDIK